MQPEEGHRGGDHIGQQYADTLPGRSLRGHRLTERERAGDQLAKTDRPALDVLQDLVRAAGNLFRVQQRVEQGAAEVAALEHHLGHQLGQLLPGIGAALAAAQLRRNAEPLRRHEGDPHLREPADLDLAGEPRERAVLGALQAHRDQWRIGLVGDHAGPFEDLHQRPGHGDAPLREDHQGLAALDHVDQGARGQRAGRVDGMVRASDRKKPTKRFLAI